MVKKIIAQLKPEEVFTPRSAAVNPKTYIHRPDLEDKLVLALRMPKHVVIHGESGTGKSWLYKKVLTAGNYHYEVANMGLCLSHGSIAGVLQSTICNSIESETVTKRTVNLGLPGVAGTAVNHENKTTHYRNSFLDAISAVSERSRGRQACLIFDNLEQVTHVDGLVKELAGYLLLVDDERYARSEVKIVLVGTSDEIRQLINNVNFSGTIANRITEIPEVSRLSDEQAKNLARLGLIDLLGCETAPDTKEYLEQFLSWLCFYSDRIPQYLQELCLYVACASESQGWLLNDKIFVEGTQEWIKSALVKDVARVQKHLNSGGTKIGRRNQIIFCLGLCHKYDFNRSDIEKIITKHFSKNANGKNLGVAQILSNLTKGDHKILTKSSVSNHYRFVDPKFRIVVRWVLYRNPETEEIQLRDFDEALSLWTKKGVRVN